jgi:lipopolysaccharide transport system ATP-binding protein
MSSSDLVISVRNLGKKYTIAHHATRPTNLREWILHRWRHPFGNGQQEHETFWALREVDFEVRQGEVLGIIGRNGAGKSTLLKLLSRIMGPTTGTIDIYGRMASLLEVGTGFHPDLTGRENIFLNGSILGMSRREVARQFDEIVAFAEIETFLDTPVKRYSSGMYVRLAFAVAAHLIPEILILDEVLAVGDTKFQKKCLSKMEEVSGQGRTVLVVSHNMATVVNLWSRGILIRAGRVVADGAVEDIVQAYLLQDQGNDAEVIWPDPDQAPGTELVRMHAVRVFQEDGKPTSDIDISKDLFLEISYWVLRGGEVIYPAMWLKDHMGTFVVASHHHRGVSLTDDPWAHRPRPPGLYRSLCVIPGNTLNDITYKITAIIGKDMNSTQICLEDVISFVAHDTGAMGEEYLGGFKGPVIRPRLAWNTELQARD